MTRVLPTPHSIIAAGVRPYIAGNMQPRADLAADAIIGELSAYGYVIASNHEPGMPERVAYLERSVEALTATLRDIAETRDGVDPVAMMSPGDG